MKYRIRYFTVIFCVLFALFVCSGCAGYSDDLGYDGAEDGEVSSVSGESGKADSEYDFDTGKTKESQIDENGTYDSKDEVALYIHTYDKLPSNYITKNEAKALGWEGGSLEAVAPGKCIGGDYFGNYEGNLPVEDEYHECDIDTLGEASRGAKRIVYSDDGDIYYTSDHYNTFELLYGEGK